MAGRPTVMTDSVLALLKEAFEWGCTDREACLHAEVDEATLYRYQEDHPDYASKKAQWKERPILKARKCVVDSLETNADMSMKYLERKKKDEFSLRTESESKLAGTIQFTWENDHNNTVQTETTGNTGA